MPMARTLLVAALTIGLAGHAVAQVGVTVPHPPPAAPLSTPTPAAASPTATSTPTVHGSQHRQYSHGNRAGRTMFRSPWRWRP